MEPGSTYARKLRSVLCYSTIGGFTISEIRMNRKLIFISVILVVCGASFLGLRKTDLDMGHEVPNSAKSDVNLLADVRYDAVGDSITFGRSVSFIVDQFGHAEKTSARFQGWPELLGDMLAKKTSERTVVSNYGYQGDRAGETRVERLAAILDTNTDSDRALLLIGANDSNDFEPTPSGENCAGLACDKTYKGEMLQIINDLRVAGRDPIYLGMLLPVWGASIDSPNSQPFTVARTVRIQEYNQVIANELSQLAGVALGPDLFSCFLSPKINRFSLFEDTLHPNTLGYVLIATLWRDAITGPAVMPPVDPCPSPVYILESLDPYVHGHKQNLLEAGDEYYTDASFTLTNVPAELANGIWVSQANADKTNTDASFLNFDAGPTAVTVYIAYDPAGEPPTSSTHIFTPAALSEDLIVSDPMMTAFGIVRTTGVTGAVSIGGNKSAPGAVAQQGYVVIVTP